MGFPPKANEMGHYALSVVAFGKGPSCVERGPNFAASYLEWTLVDKRPDLSNGGLHLPNTVDGLFRFVSPKEFSACTAVTLGDAREDGASDARRVFMKLHGNI